MCQHWDCDGGTDDGSNGTDTGNDPTDAHAGYSLVICEWLLILDSLICDLVDVLDSLTYFG